MNDYENGIDLMKQQLGHDVVISLATRMNDGVNVRNVNGYYKDRDVYVVTHMASHKMKEIEINTNVAICKDLMCAWGIGKNIGHPKDEQNIMLTKELREIFIAFYDRHVNEKDPETCILKITLNSAIVFDGSNKYMINFENETAARTPFINDIIY